MIAHEHERAWPSQIDLTPGPGMPAIEAAVCRAENALKRLDVIADALQGHAERLLGSYPMEVPPAHPPQPFIGQVDRLHEAVDSFDGRADRLSELVCRLERL